MPRRAASARALIDASLVRLAAAAITLTLALVSPRVALAADPTPGDTGPPAKRHLIQVTTRGGATWLGGDLDGAHPETGPYLGGGIGYSLATRGVDFGLAFDYLAVPNSEFPRHAIIPAVALRFHLPLTPTARTEFGLDLRAGWSWVTLRDFVDDSGDRRDHTFSGLHLGLVPHVRLWTSPRFALDLGAELLVAGGGDSMTSDVRAAHLERTARIATAGALIRGSFGL